MAIYKPSNFYPSMDEIDMLESNTFECQVNTDGSKVKAYKLNIYSDGGVLLYEKIGEFSKPIGNNDFAQIDVEPYSINLTDMERGDNGCDVKIQTDFISLFPNMEYQNRIKQCPYNIYTIIENEMYWFCVKEVLTETNEDGITSETENYNIYNIVDVSSYNYSEATGVGPMTISIGNGFSGINENAKYYICLRNDFDYKWTVRFYEDSISNKPENYINRTFVTSGYITGTSNGVVWYNKNGILFDNIPQEEKDLDKFELIDNYVKMNNYMEIRANAENSYVFENQLKKHFSCSGFCSCDGENLIIEKEEGESPLIDVSTYDLDNMYIVIKIDPTLTEAPNTDNKAGTSENIYYANLFKGDNTYIEPYFSIYLKDGYYYFVEKIINFHQILNNKWKIKIENKQLLNFLSSSFSVIKSSFSNLSANQVWIDQNTDFNYDNSFTWTLGEDSRITSKSANIEYYNTTLWIKIGIRGWLSAKITDKIIDKENNLKLSDKEESLKFSKMSFRIFETGYEGGCCSVGFSCLGAFSFYLNAEENGLGFDDNTFPSYNDFKPLTYFDWRSNDFSWNGSDFFDVSINLEYKSKNEENKKDIYNLDYFITKSTGERAYGSIKDIELDPITKQQVFSYYTHAHWTFTHWTPYAIRDLKVEYCDTSSSSLIYPFDFNYIQREKIYGHSKNLGIEKNINQILLDKDFNYYLKNSNNYLLYQCNNDNTNNSFYVSPNGEIQVGRYIRFPTIDGIPYNGTNGEDTYFPSTTLTDTIKAKKGYYVHSRYFITSKDKNENENPYLPSTSQDLFVKNKNFILYKIIGYDTDTGEIRLENDVYRKLTNTDVYEIWERREESGETTEEYYTRKLPAPEDEDTFLRVGGEIAAYIPCKNSTQEEIFIQPNVNMKSDEFYSPQLVFKNGDTVDVEFTYDTSEVYDYSLRDKTINTLDNSQWIIKTTNYSHPIKNGSEYSIYNAYVDSVPESYFYARKMANIELYYTTISDYEKYGIDDLTIYPTFSSEQSFGYNTIRMRNCVFIAKYSGTNVSIKKYRYKLYDEENNIILDSDNVYSNDLVFKTTGLKNGLIYKLYLEIEDQYGFVYTLDEKFRVSFVTNTNVSGVDFKVAETEFGNGLMVYLDAPLNGDFIEGSTAKALKELGYYSVEVYKGRVGQTYEYVSTLQIDSDNVVEWKEGPQVIGVIDYNVVNDTWYEYAFILKSENEDKEESNPYKYSMKYTLVTLKHKTCFTRWSISNIIKESDDIYKIGDIWNIKYNLEAGEITNNTSVTKWDTLGKYSQVSIGERGYDSSSVACLLGDINKHVVLNRDNTVSQKDGYNEYYSKDNYSNNADKLADWKGFCKDGQLKLLQDYKGNKWIVQILENPTHNIATNTSQQLTTISFNWTEVRGSSNISIIGDIQPYKVQKTIDETFYELLSNSWTNVKTEGTKIYLGQYKGTDTNVKLPLISGYDTYVLSTACYEDINGDIVLENPFISDQNSTSPITSFLLDNGLNLEIQCQYNKNGNKTTDNSCWDALFYNCTALETIYLNEHNTIPSSVTSLQYTFYNCNSLKTTITIDNSTSDEENINVFSMFSPTNISTVLNAPVIMSSEIETETIQSLNPEINVDIIFKKNSGNIITQGLSWYSKVGYTFKNQEEYNHINVNIVDSNYNRDNEWIFNINDWIVDTSETNLKLEFKDVNEQNIKQDVIIPEKIIYEGNVYYDIQVNFNVLRNYSFYNYNTIYLSSTTTYFKDDEHDANIFGDKQVKQLYINPNNTTYIYKEAFNLPKALWELDENKEIKKLVTMNQSDEIAEYLLELDFCSYAFWNCTKLSRVSIPDASTKISKGAFYGCSSLERILIPENISKIENWAFNNAINLKDVFILNPEIEFKTSECFYKNDGLTIYGKSDSNINIYTTNNDINFIPNDCGTTAYWGIDNETLVIIGEGDMYDWDFVNEGTYPQWQNFKDNILQLNIPEGITRIGNYAFANCKLKEIIIPKSVTEIGSYAFYRCEFNTVKFKDGNIENLIIEDFAFEQCYDLISVVLPSNIVSIGSYVFSGCANLSEINLPESLSNIGEYTFGSCGLINVTLPSNLKTISKCLFIGCNLLSSINIPESVTKIEAGAFVNCNSLKTIKIPSTITAIKSEAFKGCGSLSKVYIKDLSAWCNIDFEDAYSNPVVMARHLYVNDVLLEDLVIPDDITEIKAHTFRNLSYDLKTVKIHEGVTSIGDNCFVACSVLEKINIPSSITSIGSLAFSNCPRVNVYITDLSAWCNIDFDGYESNPVHYNSSYGSKFYLDDELITDLDIPSDVETIKAYAFYNCKQISSVAVPSSITNVESWAFYNCNNIQDVYIENLTSWCNISFANGTSNPLYYNANLRYINTNSLISDLIIPWDIEEIKSYSFIGCNSIKSLLCYRTVKYIANYSFTLCPNMTEAYVLRENVEIGSEAMNSSGVIIKTFEDLSKITDTICCITLGNRLIISGTGEMPTCSSMRNLPYGYWLTRGNSETGKHVIIDEGVTKIGSYNFYSGGSYAAVAMMHHITFPKSLKVIESYAISSYDGFGGNIPYSYNGTPEEWNNITIGTNNYI